MKLIPTILGAACACTLSCADVPSAPEVSGANIAAVEFRPQQEGTVLLTVSVSDRYGFPWLDLPTTRFYVRQLLENGTAVRAIAEPADGTQGCGWARPVDAPSAVALVLDRSALGGEVVDRTIIRGVSDAVEGASADVRLALVDVGEGAVVDSPLTADREAFMAALHDPSPEEGRSALMAGIRAGIDLIAEGAAPGEHTAVVVVTASLDDSSGPDASFASLTKYAMDQGVPVYVVAYGEAGLGAGSSLWALDDVAIGSGGRFMDGGDPIYAEHVVGSVLASVRSAYQVCIDALPVDHGDRYAERRDMLEISLTVESGGSDLQTVRPF